MADLLPFLPDTADAGGDEPRVVGMDSEAADDLIAALSSRTARRILTALHEEPVTPSALADRVDTSLQNVQYHLGRLEDAGAVEVADTAYSEKGREMRVYGPADSPLVIFAGEKERASGLRAALSRLFGGFAALALGSLAIQQVFGKRLLGTGDDAAPASGTATPTPTPTATDGSDDGGDAGAFTSRGSGTETETAEGGGTSAETDTPQGTPTFEKDSAEATSSSGTPTGGADEAADADSVATESMETATETAQGTTPTPTGDEFDLFGLVDAAFGSGLPPGLAFFLGGATVLTLFVATTHLRARP